MRWLCLLALILITLLEIGPVPITGLVLMYVVIFRPQWFYDVVQSIYKHR